MVKIELRNLAGDSIQKRGFTEFNQNTMTELDVLEKIDPAISTHAIYSIKHEYYNDRRQDGTAQNMDYLQMEQAKTEHLKSQYFKGRFGKILVKFSIAGDEMLVPLSYDPTLFINPSGLAGVHGDPRFTKEGINYSSWNSIKTLFAKELLHIENLKGKQRKSLPDMDKPNFVKKLVLIYIPRVESKLARREYALFNHEEHYPTHPAESNQDIRYQHKEISPPKLPGAKLPPPPPKSSTPPLALLPPPPPTNDEASGNLKKTKKRKSKKRKRSRNKKN